MRIPKLKDFLCEMAFERRKIINKCSSLSDPIILHLIKLLRYHDPENYQKHLKNVNNWLQQIQSMDYKKSNKKLKFEDYYNCLYLEPFTSPTNTQYIEKLIVRRLEEYKELPLTDLSISQIAILVEKVLHRTAMLISEDALNNFITDVWNQIIPEDFRKKNSKPQKGQK